MKKKSAVIVSGYFNPLHSGHIRLLEKACALGDILLVIVNNDRQVKLKGSKPFMKMKERIQILEAIKYVDAVYPSVDYGRAVIRTLRRIAKEFKNYDLIFANGGDVKFKGDVPERFTCYEFGIRMVFNVGGDKIQSSSKLKNEKI